MPERPLLVAAYAAGAGLAAATLVYVFGPTYLLDNEGANSSRAGKKRSIVGLSNPANDCFINSVLQALAGSPQLRLYLIKEIHLRKLYGSDIQSQQHSEKAADKASDRNSRMRATLQAGLITIALKEMLDALNERPIAKKTVTAQPLISAVEQAFNTRVSRYQQDAQEFLQILLERLADEHKELNRVCNQLGERSHPGAIAHDLKVIEDLLDDVTLETKVTEGGREAPQVELDGTSKESIPGQADNKVDLLPFGGKLESQIECTVCSFKPKASVSDFVTLTLNVPNDLSSTTLDACFDGVLKIEHIDGFRCDRCRLMHALQMKRSKLSRSSLPGSERTALQQDCLRIEEAIKTDPEHPPKDLELPPVASAPTTRITKHMRISLFPKVLAIHLSRSMWDAHYSSSKNMAKVSFPEILALGPLLDRKNYQLFSLVTHKGGHNSGHYETFRRQWAPAPYSTPATMGTHGAYSKNSTPVPSPLLSAAVPDEPSREKTTATAADQDIDQISATRTSDPIMLDESTTQSERMSFQPETGKSTSEKRSSLLGHHARSKKRPQDRWWRISDDKIKECKVPDVLSMQREVYLLFYELQ